MHLWPFVLTVTQPLHYGIESQKAVKALLDAGADIDAKESNGRTALFYAVEAQSEAVVRLLVSRHANLGVRDNELKQAVDLADGYIRKGATSCWLVILFESLRLCLLVVLTNG